MSRFIKNISLFLAGLPLAATRTMALPAVGTSTESATDNDAVSLRPLNRDIDNLFAGHRSHSSHASHASHYSGSRGGSVAPAPPAIVAPSAPVIVAPVESTATPATPAAAIAAPVLGAPVPSPSTAESTSTTYDKLKLQIMRVQVKLLTLGFYDGHVDGIFDPKTKQALKSFQSSKKLPQTGLMNTPTLNALGVPASN